MLGQKDKHLDFYVVLECLAPMGSWQDIHVSTYVTYHNFLGKLYFGGIRIFHVFLVKSLLNRAARLWMKNHSNTHVLEKIESVAVMVQNGLSEKT